MEALESKTYTTEKRDYSEQPRKLKQKLHRRQRNRMLKN